jgi:hypothetical protein
MTAAAATGQRVARQRHFLFGASLDASDRVDGGRAGGGLWGHSGELRLELGDRIAGGIETLTPLSGSRARFGVTQQPLFPMR